MPTTSESLPPAAPRLLDQVWGKIRLKHYSIRTEQAYVNWIRRFICHFGKHHPRAKIKGAKLNQVMANNNGASLDITAITPLILH